MDRADQGVEQQTPISNWAIEKTEVVYFHILVLESKAGHKMKKAIVTLAIGKPYEAMFEKNCQSLWSLYAKKHNFDLIVITDPLDRTPRAQSRTPAWQKMLDFFRPQSSAL